jgi:uncharacterized protein
MLVNFFLGLRAAGVPVSTPEFLTLLRALEARVATVSVDDFYWLGRLCLVKDERHFDRYDQVYGRYFEGVETAFQVLAEGTVPASWLESKAALLLSPEEQAAVRSLGGFEELMRALSERLAEQKGRHEGGSKWVGTRGKSPFGNDGYNPEGVRVGGESRNQRAVKVWERREFRNLDGDVELGTRNIKLALRRLRRFAREGVPDQLDLDGTIEATARNAGYLDLKLVAERRNAMKVLLLLDVGGSMDPYVRLCEELFSAARAEFRHLRHFYFHNCVYESLWIDNRRRHSERMPTYELLRTYGPDYRLIIVGDATMSPYEITQPGGSVEHWNEEAGSLWLRRLVSAFPHAAWLNPQREDRWQYTQSIGLAREVLEDRMYPLTLAGIDRAARALRAG